MGLGDGWNTTHWQVGRQRAEGGQAVVTATGGRAGVPAETVSTS